MTMIFDRRSLDVFHSYPRLLQQRHSFTEAFGLLGTSFHYSEIVEIMNKRFITIVVIIHRLNSIGNNGHLI